MYLVDKLHKSYGCAVKRQSSRVWLPGLDILLFLRSFRKPINYIAFQSCEIAPSLIKVIPVGLVYGI
jgi:hypothetical protein